MESGDLGEEEDLEDLIPDDDQIPDRFPYIVVLIDELADLMQTAPARVPKPAKFSSNNRLGPSTRLK